MRALPVLALLCACNAAPTGSADPATAAPKPGPEPAKESPPTVKPNDTPVDTGRPPADLERDAARKPQEVMDFAGIEPGMRVAELMSGGGYYADLLSRRVGPSGAVFAHNRPFVFKRFAEKRIAKRLENPALGNVQRLDTELEDPKLPAELDAVLIFLFYHDLYWQQVDRGAMNRAVFTSLRPGGVFTVIDHSALDGHGSDDVKSLHRVEESLVTKEILAVGFELAAASDMLRNADDPRDYNVFSPPDGRDKTDRFVLKFVKPKS
ncbi:MAG: SAM-dependent methyltransferase [Myxococcota bacterium]